MGEDTERTTVAGPDETEAKADRHLGPYYDDGDMGLFGEDRPHPIGAEPLLLAAE